MSRGFTRLLSARASLPAAAVALACSLALARHVAHGRAARGAPIAQRGPQQQVAPCTELEARVCQELGAASEACALAREQLRAATAAQCQAALPRPEQTARAFRDQAAAIRELKTREPRSPHGPAPQLGPPEAELTAVVFADFQSDDCGRAAPMVHVLRQLYPERVRVVFRQYPAPDHPQARLAAQASLAAHAQGKFWQYHDLLFANPHDLQRPALERYAAEVGLDLDAFRQALDTRRFEADVDADLELGHRVHAVARPSLFLNGERVDVPFGVAELKELIESLSSEQP